MFRNLLRKPIIQTNKLVYVSSRNKAKVELPFQWERPPKELRYLPHKAGDLEPLKEIDLTRLCPIYEKSKELESADKNVKSLCTLKFLTRDELCKVIRQDYVDEVKRHELDKHSQEAVIAALTASIRHLQKYVATFNVVRPPRSVRVRIKELIDQREKYLRTLRYQDYKLFEWVLERLNLVYKPPPVLGVEQVERKKSLKRLTDIYCENLQKERLGQYRNKLESQQEDFMERKIEKFKWIQAKEKEYNIKPSVTDDDINDVKNGLEEMKVKKREE